MLATAEGCEIRMKLYSLDDNTFERNLLLTSDTALTPESAESSVAFRFPFNKNGVNEFFGRRFLHIGIRSDIHTGRW